MSKKISKNVNFLGIKNLQKIINKLGIKAKELECEGVSNISQLLTGAKAITEKVSAPALVKKINEIIEEKQIDLEFDVTIDLLLGKINIITNDLLNDLEKEAKDSKISSSTISDIDNNIKELPNEKAIEFLFDVIQILYYDDFGNAHLVRKYALKLLNLKLDFDNRMKAYKDLIISYRCLKKYDDIVYVAESIEDELNNCRNKSIKSSCYTNIAFAYYKEGKSKESICYYKKLKQLGKNNNELLYLTQEADLYATENDFKKAEKMYMNVISKASIKGDYNYIVNSYSNIADIYRERDLLDEAKQYINKAIDKINCGVINIFKLNVYYNAFLIYNEFEVLEELFYKALPLAIELKNLEKINFLIHHMFNEYLKNKEYNKIFNIIEQTKGLGINPDILVEVIENIKNSL